MAFTTECCWIHQHLPLGKTIVGMRVQIDEEQELIAQLELFLGGEEMQYPTIDGFVDFGDNSKEWTYEWPTQKDLEKFDILTIKQDLKLSSINIKKSG